jgi:hypothetical protein
MNSYQKTFDFAERAKLLRELDGILSSEHHWLFEWTAPYERVVYWSKFGHPPGYLTRIGDYQDLVNLWWFDARSSNRVADALKNPSEQLGEGPSEDQYWLEFAKREVQGTPGTR